MKKILKRAELSENCSVLMSSSQKTFQIFETLERFCSKKEIAILMDGKSVKNQYLLPLPAFRKN